MGQTGPLESPMVPGDSRWDCGTDRTLGEPNGGGNPCNIAGTPGGTVGETGPWEIPMVVGIPETSQGLPVGQTGPWEIPMVVGIPGILQGLLVGLWDRQDRGRAQWLWESLEYCRDSWWDCGTDRTVGEPNGGGYPWYIAGTPGGTVGQTGPWESPMVVGIPGTSRGFLVGLWDRNLGEPNGGGNPLDIAGTSGGNVDPTGTSHGPTWNIRDRRDGGTLVPLVGYRTPRDFPGSPGTRGCEG